MRVADDLEQPYEPPVLTAYGTLHELTANSLFESSAHFAPATPSLSGVATPPGGGGSPPPGGGGSPPPGGGGTLPGGGSHPGSGVLGETATPTPTPTATTTPVHTTTPPASGVLPTTAVHHGGGAAPATHAELGAGERQLPFTGFAVGTFATVGAALTGAGAALRRFTRKR